MVRSSPLASATVPPQLKASCGFAAPEVACENPPTTAKAAAGGCAFCGLLRGAGRCARVTIAARPAGRPGEAAERAERLADRLEHPAALA